MKEWMKLELESHVLSHPACPWLKIQSKWESYPFRTTSFVLSIVSEADECWPCFLCLIIVLPSKGASIVSNFILWMSLFVQSIYLVSISNRYKLRNQLNLSFKECIQPMVLLIEATASLIEPSLPWDCKTVEYLSRRNIFADFREIVLIVQVCFSLCQLLNLAFHYMILFLISFLVCNPCLKIL